MSNEEISQFSNLIHDLCQRGGPDPHEYDFLNSAIIKLHTSVEAGMVSIEDLIAVLDQYGEPFSLKTMQGLALRKPRGYAGDFEMIDKIYLNHKSPDERLEKWDLFFHAQHSPRAVRNRKTYFHSLLDSLPRNAKILKLGCGPGRSMYEWLVNNPKKLVSIECLDVDKDAIEFAKQLNEQFHHQLIFHHKNVFKYSPSEENKYDLIWAAGLFDYFDDKTFIALGARFFPHLKEDGELVIGNFSTNNPTRPYMELFGSWYLHHRDETKLSDLGRSISSTAHIRVDREPEGVNLFLHLRQA